MSTINNEMEKTNMNKKTITKNKLLIIMILIVTVVGISSVFFAKIFHDGTIQEFDKSGYVVVANNQAESEVFAFSPGTKYTKKILGGYEFNDIQKNNVELDENHFVYFDDHTYSSFTKGVLLNFEDVKSGVSIQHYTIPTSMQVIKNGNKYQIINKEKPVDIEEGLWKIADNKFLLLSEDIEFVLNDKDVRKAGNHIEINYIDKGVIQLVSEDNVWQTVSTTAYLKTSSGSQIDLFDQLITVDKKQMLMSKLVINSDENIELSPLETKKQTVPEIDIDGKDGDDGTSGDNGSLGESGGNGTNGSQGVTGNNGTSGDDGTNGNGGTNGTNGNKGNSGSGGAAGSTPGIESSQKTAIPSIGIANWKVTATSISGEYKVTDENSMLNDYLDISVYEAGSGKKIECVNNNDQSGVFDYFKGEEFKVNINTTPLTPDTEYRLIIKGKYEMGGLDFEREFVSRVFYTDSLGVLLSKNYATPSLLSIDISKKDYSSATSVSLYLLTDEQVKTFDPTQASNTYIKETVDFATGTDHNVTLTQDKHNLLPNTHYTLRMVVHIGNDHTYLTQQILNLTTLKRSPSIDSQPYGMANRQLGAFELFGGQVVDEDNAIVSYTYEIYNTETNETVKSMDVKPSAVNQATILYIDNKTILYNTKYAFKVIALYNDNEKVIEKESLLSPEFVLTSANLPAVRMEVNEVQYNKIHGELIIELNGSKITASENSPLNISMECEGVFGKTFSFKSLNDPDIIATESQIRIQINENHLSAGKIYRMTVTGQVDLGDENSRRVIGSIVKATPSLTQIKAIWSINSASGNAISRVLKLEGSDNPAWNENSYDGKTLSKVIVELYRGSGTGKVYMASKEYVDTIEDPYKSSIAKDFIQEGVEITENTFGYQSSLLTAQTYTLRVSAVYDYTATVSSSENTNSGNYSHYTNEYTLLETTREEQVSKATQPPSLPDLSATMNQVSAEPIYNKDAGSYNQEVNKNLADDSIVGYRLKANYDNYAKLARQVNYYVFESTAFDNMVNAKENPIYDHANNKIHDEQDSSWLVKKDINIEGSTLNIPTMAIFFENAKNTADYTYNGVYVKFAGDLETEKKGDYEDIKAGMSRGYKYTFAYTVSYNPTGTGGGTTIYPYQHPSYNGLYNTPSATKAYVLNFGNINCPKTNPTFMAFPWVSNKNGTMEAKYQYRDVDKTIPKDAPVMLNTNGVLTPIGVTIDSTQNAWNTLNLSNLPTTSGATVEPKVKRNLYNLNYGETETVSMFHFALDNEGTFNVNTAQEGIDYSIDRSKLSNNILEVKLKSAGDSPNDYLKSYKKRITSLRIKIVDTTGVANSKIYLVPFQAETSSAMMSTSKLSEFLAKQIKISVDIVYDNGMIGWENSNPFAMQRVKVTPATGKVSLDNYINFYQESGSLITSANAGGSHFKAVTTNGELQWVDETLSKNIINYQSSYTDTNASTTSTMIGTFYGLSTYNVNNPTAINVMIPKGLSSASLIKCSDGSSELTLGTIAPSVSITGYNATLNQITLHNVLFNGINVIDQETDGNKYIIVKLKNSKGNVIEQKIDVTKWTGLKSLTLQNLVREEKYNITMYALVNGKQVQLLDANSYLGAYWNQEVSMKNSVSLTRVSASYIPISYSTKQISVGYYLDQLSGFMIEFDIYDTSGNIVYTNKELIDEGLFSGYTPGQGFQNYMTAAIKVPLKNTKLLSGKSYRLQISAKSLLADNTVSDEILGTESTTFDIPVPSVPIPFVSMTPNYDQNSKKIYLEAEYSLGDLDKVVMTNKDGKGTYYARLYKMNKEGTVEDITPSDMKDVVYQVGSVYRIKVENVEPNTRYSLFLYACIDTNNDGVEDRTDLEQSIDEITDFDTYMDRLSLWEETVTTPGANGIGFGEMNASRSDNDSTKVSMTYKNASNLNSIRAIDYSIISNDGTVRLTGRIDNSDQSKFVAKAVGSDTVPGYFELELPPMLEVKGLYRIILDYYLDDGSGTLVKMSDKHTLQYVYN